ncbi:class I SAM-dependent methyltransferase [Streptomyces iconiensis]|uniref:Class I SAM-dependent methyltransferase n=1 Tax=Streptomyces iconiensis TaxID=1384038 RepID=A0ABT6ZP85_9ACTN|nr:class I SAM-dependent methyltransferase [Streptomyces iconiensis]MDJ1130861.1 class I SAM-dependent methyltransferase [Streptomyces iconiensis]
MPTIRPEGASPSGNEPHQQRDLAEAFGTEAERYDRTRPRYPTAMVERIAGAAPGPDVLDVGCGTGIASRQFQAAGCRVLGVDADARMAGLARRYGLEAEVAAFEDWDPAGRTFDAVVAGQTWHWVDPAAGAARAATVLRPGGRLAVFWNVDQPPPELAAAFFDVYQRVLPDSPVSVRWKAVGPDAYAALCARAADGMRAAGAFGEPEEWRFDWERTYTRDEWLDQLMTHGGHIALPAATREELVAGIGAAIDAVGGDFTMRYTAVVVTAARTGTA